VSISSNDQASEKAGAATEVLTRDVIDSGKSHERTYLSAKLMPCLVFCLGLVVSAGTALWWRGYIHDDAMARFEKVAERISEEVTSRFVVSGHGLVGARGMLATHGAVRRDDFRIYAESRSLLQEFPGIKAFAFVQKVNRSALDHFVAAARKDGITDFSIKKLDSVEQENLYVVRVIEPEKENKAALGVDIASESRRREGVLRAVETGLPAVSKVISLVQDEQSRAAVLLNVPVFRRGADISTVAARMEAAVGVVNAPIVIADLLNTIPEIVAELAKVELFESKGDFERNAAFYNSYPAVQGLKGADSAFSVTRMISPPGGTWLVKISSLNGYENGVDYSSSWLIFSTGALLCGLLSLFMWRQGLRRWKAEVLASNLEVKANEQERRFRDFSQSSADWFWETDSHHRFSYLSENSPHILNSRSLDSLLGKSRMEIALGDGLYTDSMWGSHIEVLALHKPFRDFEYCVLDGEGKIAWLAVSGIPVFDANGEFSGYRGVGQIITERRRIQSELLVHQSTLEILVASREDELRTAEARFKTVIDASLDGIIQVDGGGKIVLVNPAACSMLGHTADALSGHELHQTIHHSFPDGKAFPAEECPVARAIATGESLRSVQDYYWRADGTSFPVICSFQPVHSEGGIIGGVLTFSDDTARVEAEKAQENARLAAENLARMKSEFLANMSHEIRTPLNGVLGVAQIGFREHSQQKRTRELFGRILASGDILLGVINEILDFSKIEAGKLTVESVPLDPLRIAEDALSICAEKAKEKNLSLSVVTGTALPDAMLGDPVRLSQILINLISNAVKFTETGGVTLGLEKSQDEFRFSVADTGIGMTADQIGRLFNPFEQADASTTRNFGGTGLGLAISKRLAFLMGGTIEVQSEKDVGSTFTLTIPYRYCAMAARNVSPNLFAEGCEPRLEGLRILAAEDNEFNQLVLADMLGGEGAKLSLVGNGQLALEAVAQDPGGFDIVLMDVQMPIMDGRSASLAIRKIAPSLKIVGLTAHAIPAEHAECLAAGMVDVVTKPYKNDELVGCIVRNLGLPSQGCRAVTPVTQLPAVTYGEQQTSPSVIDWTKLESKYALRPDFLHRLINIFLQSNIDRPEQIRAAGQGDFSTLAAIAHSLKGSAHHIDAQKIFEQAVATEVAIQQAKGNIADLAEGLARTLDLAVLEAQARIASYAG